MPVHWRLRVLVALPAARDLLLCAKHLFVGARIAWHGLQSLRGEPRPGWPARNHLKVPTMRGCPLLRTLSECNNCHSRATRPDTNRSWELPAAPCRSLVHNSCRSRSSLRGTICPACAVAAMAIAARARASAAAHRTDDDQYFHYISFAKAATTSPPQQCLKRSQRRSSQSAEQLCKDLRRSPRRRLASAIAPRPQWAARRRRLAGHARAVAASDCWNRTIR